MSKNRGVVYLGPGMVEVQQNIDDPRFTAPDGKKIEHAVILKVVSTMTNTWSAVAPPLQWDWY